MKKLKTAVIGLGRIGWECHLPSAHKHAGFDLVAVADPLEERLVEARGKFGVRGYTRHTDLLQNEKLDLVVVASPTHCHAEHSIAAMEAGVDVFCDKPMAPNLAEVDRMIEAITRTGRKLMIHQSQRASAETAAIRHILDSGLLGPVFMIKYSTAYYTRRNDWQALRKYGGGILNNYGVHAIDMLFHVAGGRAARVACHLRKIASLGDADDVVKALIEMENGIVIDLEINMASALPLSACVLLGQRGAAKLDHEQKIFRVQYFKEEELPRIPLATEPAAPGRQYDSGAPIPWQQTDFPISNFPAIDFYTKCHEYFALNQEPFVPIQQTREVMRVIEQCRRSAGWNA